MKYWLIAIAIIIIIACLIYSYNNVIEGLDENPMIKYYEDTSRIDNMIRMITMKITELRMTLQNNYVNMLTPDNVNKLEDERNTALGKLTPLQTTTEKEKENKDTIDDLKQTIDEITDALSIIRYQSQVDYLDNAKKIITTQYDIYYLENKIELIQKEIDDDKLSDKEKSEKQTEIELIQEELDDETNKLSDKEKSEKQTEIELIQEELDDDKLSDKEKSKKQIEIGITVSTRDSQILNLKERKTENEAKLKTDAGLEDGSKVYVPLQNIIDGKSSSSGSNPSTTYDIPVDENGKFNPSKFYNYINDDAAKLAADENKGTWVKDKDGKMINLDDLIVPDTYYEPGSYKYDSGLYVPSYQDSVYLSKTTGKHTASEYLDMASLAGGICTHYKDQPEKLEEECAKLDKNICGSTSCCALLGGSKCVAGNAQGPISQLNYGDITVQNRDFYYYKGKCYGNCVSQTPTPNADANYVAAAKPTGKVNNGENNKNGNTSTKM